MLAGDGIRDRAAIGCDAHRDSQTVCWGISCSTLTQAPRATESKYRTILGEFFYGELYRGLLTIRALYKGFIGNYYTGDYIRDLIGDAHWGCLVFGVV